MDIQHNNTPKIVYLDWMIFSSLREGDPYGLLPLIMQAQQSGRFVFPYSLAHIEEAFRGLRKSDHRLVVSAIQIIRKVSGGIYWASVNASPEDRCLLFVDPIAVYNQHMADKPIEDHDFVQEQWTKIERYLQEKEECHKVPMMDLLPLSKPKTYLELKHLMLEVLPMADFRVLENKNPMNIGWSAETLNQKSGVEVVNHIDDLFRSQEERSVYTIIDSGGWGSKIHDKVVAVNAILNSVGYSIDTPKKLGIVVGSYSDAAHLSFATYADIFVTNDRKFTKRAIHSLEMVGSKTQLFGWNNRKDKRGVEKLCEMLKTSLSKEFRYLPNPLWTLQFHKR